MFSTHLKIQTQLWVANATSVCDYLGSKYRALAWKWRLGRVSTSAPRSGAHHDQHVRTSEEVLTSLLVLLRIYHTVGADKSLMGEGRRDYTWPRPTTRAISSTAGPSSEGPCTVPQIGGV